MEDKSKSTIDRNYIKSIAIIKLLGGITFLLMCIGMAFVASISNIPQIDGINFRQTLIDLPMVAGIVFFTYCFSEFLKLIKIQNNKD